MSAPPIAKVCVIGAGVMGAGIAAQIANAGLPVLLLDVAGQGAPRDAAARAAVARMLKAEPAPFMSAEAAALVQTGSIEDDLGQIADCDWVIEAVVERLDIKQSLYARIEALKRPGTAVSSNTSTIPLEQLTEGRSDAFRRDFLITHFFNPPRYMRLVEIVTGPQTDPDLAARVTEACDRTLGKRVVRAKDTPGFIANRIGTYWLATAMNAALDLGLTVEEADQIGGEPMGVPRTGVFGLIDLVGVDLIPLLSASLGRALPAGDAYFETVRELPLIDTMIAEGLTGRKGKGGFYRLVRGADGRRAKEALDLQTGAYRPEQKPEPLPRAATRDLAALIDLPGKSGAFAWTVLGRVLAYAASLVGEAAEDVVAIDDAMKLGYNWRFGPFELIDRLGAGALAERLAAEGRPVPAVLKSAQGRAFYQVDGAQRRQLTLAGDYAEIPRPDGVLLLEDVKRASSPLAANASAALWDIGDGVACLEFTGKMNVLDAQVFALIEEAARLADRGFKALVVYNDGQNFSAGADLNDAVAAIGAQDWAVIDGRVALGQQAFKALKYAPIPVVGAPAGLALGGGCEILLNCDAIQAHAESYIGLVEVGVGIIPGWSGCGEMLTRLTNAPGVGRGPLPPVVEAFQMISTAQVSKSAAQARAMHILRPTDGVTMNRDRLLADAKAKALALVPGYAPPQPPVFRLPGEGGRLSLRRAVEDVHRRGQATDYDVVVCARLARVLAGGEADLIDVVTEAQILALEREALAESVRDPRTLARLEHMLATGKPLRN